MYRNETYDKIKKTLYELKSVQVMVRRLYIFASQP